MEYEEHEKRAWSIDFSRTEPSMLVSGSDDCKVRITRGNVFFRGDLGFKLDQGSCTQINYTKCANN